MRALVNTTVVLILILAVALVACFRMPPFERLLVGFIAVGLTGVMLLLISRWFTLVWARTDTRTPGIAVLGYLGFCALVAILVWEFIQISPVVWRRMHG